MKIIQVIPDLASGGAERFTVDLSNELSLLGHEVIVCSLFPLDGEHCFYSKQVNRQVRLISMDKGEGFSVKTIIKLTRFLITEHPDIIHTHLRAIPYTAIYECFKGNGIHTIHNEAQVEAYDLLNKICRKVLFSMKKVYPITISPESQKSYLQYYKKNALLINNGRNVPANLSVSEFVQNEISNYKINSNTKVIIHLAHIDKVKQQILLAKVARKLYDEGFNFSILFIGSQRGTEYVKALKKEIPSCAHILGERSNPLEYLKEAGACVLCSKYEGLPISLIEALGVSAIPICFRVGGIPNIIQDGFNGILTSTNDEEALYEALKKYLTMSDQDIAVMSSNARQSYLPYNMTLCAKKYLNVYEQIKNRK